MNQRIYRYYSRRPIVPGSIPSTTEYPPASVENYEYPLNPEYGVGAVWGHVEYLSNLPEDVVSSYELIAARTNHDVWQRMSILAELVGPIETAQEIPDCERYTWYAQDFGCYTPTDLVSLKELEERATLLGCNC